MDYKGGALSKDVNTTRDMARSLLKSFLNNDELVRMLDSSKMNATM